ncbi:hypothetical protein LCGC14_1400970 [marine sediment metagenome]|uniref:Uncharacterized protein n=1 Tax=marine sediment metagenome TaxID=412755 RepID=A0A0F9JXE1_9ZZZZ|nr:MAG: hypothetical protein Lokiarch_38710 [Candidatus Lokiarchaeum sp. GC14_75]
MVTSIDVRKIFYTKKFDEVGINSASTFFGFCNNHDTTVFSEIENLDYNKTLEQNFLYAYRACALEYVKKTEACNHQKNMIKRYRNSQYYDMLNFILISTQQGFKEISEFLEIFSVEFKKPKSNRNLNIINTRIFYLPYESLIAVNSLLTIHYDFQEVLINDLSDPSRRPAPIFLNVFPQKGKTIILFSYLSVDINVYKSILSELGTFSNSKIEHFFSNLIIVHCENLFMSPQKYNNIPNKMRKLIVSKFIKTITKPPQPDYLSQGSPNLFKYLKK